MKLTPDDKQLLSQWGNLDNDIEQICEAIRRTTYTAYATDSKKGRRVSANTAVKILGRKEFLSGISRSAFHFDAIRENVDGIKVSFDSRKLFQ